ncbi:MAG TPA: multicopper oxidase domain-containing protein [Longimicrobium sp.]|nr:multicopper oxidase domain-containing protein [Longimicrobium sp.]
MTEHRVPDPPQLRRFVRDLAGVAALSAAIVAGCTPGLEPGPVIPATATPTPIVNRLYQDSLRDPLVVRSVNGVLSATLDVSIADLTVTRDGAIEPDTVIRDTVTTDTIPLRAYTLAATTDPAYAPNDPRFTPRFPGPTFRVRPGDLVQIWLRNKLPPPVNPSNDNDVCMSYPAASDTANPPDIFQDCLHGPNYTNIHYHGMHVTPDSTSTVIGDDVLLAIPPGDSILYSFRIPMNQSPGTHWYHPHKHGSVALQVANGMSGAFIVVDTTTGVDRFAAQFNIREHLIAFQQIDTAVGLLHGDQVNILDKVPPLVNGQNYPTIYMAPGEVQRWRIVNENVTSNTKTLEFRFEDRPGQEPVVVEVARDGVQYAPINIAQGNDSLLLVAAGNRLDVFVQAPLNNGEHLMRVRHISGASLQTRRQSVLPLALAAGRRGNQITSNDYRVFRVVVDSALAGRAGSSRGLPGSVPNLSAFLGSRIPDASAFLGVDLPAASDTAVVVFTDSWHPGSYLQPTQFYLGSATNPSQRFNDTVVFIPSDVHGTSMPMYLDSTQTWKVVNNSPNQINHPFHIHINPFQVDSVYAPYGANDPYYALYQELNEASRRGSPIWMDVLPLPQPTVDTSGAVIDTAYAFITQRYDRFTGCSDGKCGPPTGDFVMHCHILGHEERGMMQVLRIQDHGQPTARAPGQGGGGPAQQRQDPQPEHRH